MFLNKIYLLCSIIIFSSAFQKVLGDVEIENGAEWCPSWKNLVCGPDGISYWNECLLNKSINGSSSSQMSAGACELPQCDDCDSEKEKLHICTTSNKLFTSKCMFNCFLEDFPHGKEDYQGCRNEHPSIAEQERTSTDLLIDIVETFVNKAMKIEAPETESAVTHYLEPFHGFMQHDFTLYTIKARNGWMQAISLVSNPTVFYLSSKVPGRFLMKIKTEFLEAGYNYFMITSGRARGRTPLSLSLKNVTMQLIADFKTDQLNCTRLVTVQVELIEIPFIDMATLNDITTSIQFPKHTLEGFIKEHFVKKINEAIEKTLTVQMNRVGCLSWPLNSTGGHNCFGAFQTRFCMP